MTLSILIVNYNVCYFLEQCLLSVQAAITYTAIRQPDFEAQILVMDNASGDNSLEYLPGKFPSVRFIPSAENLGFSRANNDLLKIAKGKFVLFLNPDTLLPEDCFLKQLNYLAAVPAAGGCGIRMIDGSGRYLPESKRGFPGLWNSFTKMSGLAGWFPGQPAFNGYYAGKLDPRQSNPVPVLSGAYLMVRKSALDLTGGFDERFFMYAEDIDLSYRLEMAGFHNHYFAGSTIIHFKGESTKKDKIYTERFYGAMILFVKKHFHGVGGRLYTRLLEVAVRALAMIAAPAATSVQELAQGALKFPAEARMAGDPQSIRKMEELTGVRLPRSKISQEDSSDETPPVVYCLGPEFSYKDLISAVDEAIVAPVLIYHPAAGAIIGSHSKNSQGTVYIL